MDFKEFDNTKDEAIVTILLEQGRKELFQILYKRYNHKVLNKCHSMIKNHETAHEMTQIVFSRVYEKLASFKGASSFSSWLYAITYNCCIDYLRDKKKLHYPEWDRSNEIPEIIDEIGEGDEIPDYEKLILILDKIHPEEKALILMKYQDNIPVKIIAEALRITESAAKMRLKRARARILFLYKKSYK